MNIRPERSVAIIYVDRVTEHMISFLVANYESASIGEKEIRFNSEKDKEHFEINYGKS